jgi:transcriptional regulator with XRE-family HTH domain
MDFRLRKNMSQKELAERAGITAVYMSNVENAHSRIGLTTILKVANALGTGIDALLGANIKESRDIFEERLGELLADCTEEELKLIIGTVKGLKEQIRATKIEK